MVQRKNALVVQFSVIFNHKGKTSARINIFMFVNDVE